MRHKQEIDRAVQMGERNKYLIELAMNFCKHLRVEQSAFAGIGMLEQMTGLPISGRDCKCQYARAKSVSGMNFEGVAVDFYERNCRDCDKREPVGFPNLSLLIDEKKQEESKQAEIQSQIKDLRNQEYQDRNKRRNSYKSKNPVKNNILDLIDLVDKEYKRSESKKIIETAKLAPEKFDNDLINSLLDLANTKDFFKCELAFEALTIIANNGKSLKDGDPVAIEHKPIQNGVDVNLLVKLALKALSSRSGNDDAAGVVYLWLTKDHESDVTNSAIYTLIRLAFPNDHFSLGSITYNPIPLLKVFKFFPDKVLNVIRELLTNEDKGLRIVAAGSVGFIAEKYPDQILNITEDLLKSVLLPDDGYDGGSASGVVAKTVSKIFLTHPNEVDLMIQNSIKSIRDEEVGGEIFSIYEDVLAEEKFQDKVKLKIAQRIAAKRILNTINEKPYNHILDNISTALGRSRYHGYDVYEGYEDLFITAAANLTEELNNPYSPLTDPEPSSLKQMESHSRRLALTHAVDNVQICLGNLGRKHPDTVGQKIIDCIENFQGDNLLLKSMLISSLGNVGCNQNGISLVIPILNKAFTDKECIIRYAAVEAYGILAKANFESLPSSLHEYFYASITDPYGLVHKKAVQILNFERIKIPDKAIVKQRLIALILAYLNEGKNLDFLASCIDVLLDMIDNSKPIDDKLGKFIIKVLPKISPYERNKLILHNKYQLKSIEGYAEVLASLILEEYLYQLNLDETVDLIRLLETAEIYKVRSILCEGAQKMVSYGLIGHSFEIIEILSLSLCWPEILKISGFLLKNTEDTVENKPLRLKIEAFNIAARIEEDLYKKAPQNQVSADINKWNSNIDAIREDHEKNADRRDFFRGIRLPRKNS